MMLPASYPVLHSPETAISIYPQHSFARSPTSKQQEQQQQLHHPFPQQYQPPYTQHKDESRERILLKITFIQLLIIAWQIIYAFIVLPMHSLSNLSALSSSPSGSEDALIPAIYRQSSPLREHVILDHVPQDYFSRGDWYDFNYWSVITPNLDAAMNGFGMADSDDILESNHFVADYFKQFPLERVMKQVPAPDTDLDKFRALDAGAGIGRVSKLLLLQWFDGVDLLEPSESFRARAESFLRDDEEADLVNTLISNNDLPVRDTVGQVEKYYDQWLWDFHPEHRRYDMIWMQWTLQYLKDDDIVKSLRQVAIGLKDSPNACIVVKDDVSTKVGTKYIVNERDHSVVRSRDVWMDLFQQAGYEVALERVQEKFPKYHYPVFMWAIKPVVALG
eukprot:Partr_v1_DN27299_c1_g1_i3_m38887 putative o-methyltransferase